MEKIWWCENHEASGEPDYCNMEALEAMSMHGQIPAAGNCRMVEMRLVPVGNLANAETPTRTLP